MQQNFDELLICNQRGVNNQFLIQTGKDYYINRKPFKIDGLYIFFTGYLFNFDELNTKKFNRVEELIADYYLNKRLSDLTELFEGYFSAIIIDQDRVTILMDKYGIETGYYVHDKQKSGFIFSTSLKLLHSVHSLSLSRNSIVNYLLFEDLPEGETLFDGIYKIKRGEHLVFESGSIQVSTDNIKDSLDINDQAPFKSDDEILICLDKLLDQQFTQIQNNLPNTEVWNQLSGGVDSSLLQVFLSKTGYSKSYCANLSGYGMDGQYSGEVAEHLKCDHQVFDYSIDGVIADMNNGISCLLNPCIYIGESMFFRSFNELSGSKPLLCISGNGADALFGHGLVLKVLKLHQTFPALFGNLLRLASKRVKKLDFFRFAYPDIDMKRFVLSVFSNAQMKELFTDEKLVHDAASKKVEEVFQNEDAILNQVYASQIFHGEVSRQNPVIYKLAKMNNIMIRFPYLQEDFVTFMRRIPVGQKLKRFQNKYYAKKYLEKHLPESLIYRKKQGKQMPWEHLFTQQSKVTVTKFVKTELDEILKEDAIEHCYGKSGYEGLSLKLINLYNLHQTLRV